MYIHLLRPGIVSVAVLGFVGCGADSTGPIPPATRVSTTLEHAVTANTWLTRRDMPLDLVSLATAVVPNAAGQSILYAIAGRKAQSSPLVPMGEVRAYNFATNTWDYSRKDMPVARFGMNGAGVIDGKIYVTGGFASKSQPSASVFVYNPASNTWTQKRNMPAPGGGGVTGVIGGKLYVVTFTGLPDTVATFFRYDPTTDSWTRLPRPTNYSNLDVGGGVFNNKFYLIGPRVLVYDPATNEWTKKGSFGSGLWGRTVVLLSHLYVIGASLDIGGVPTPGIFIYDPVSDTWETKPLLTTFNWWDRGDLAATRVFLNGQPRVEVLGGVRDWPGGRGTNQQYAP